jgi:diguanylate cyclase (GGDEF)-like protein
VRRGELLGFLSMGSVDPERYTNDMATDFVDRLSSIVTLCIQNAIHLEKLKLMGLVDPLTKAKNRRYFFRRLGEEILRAQRGETPISCLYIDIDHFKKINDEFGHTGGDMALIHAVSVLQDAVRESDIIARLGGEEFAVILPETAEAGAFDVANRIVESFRNDVCELDEDNIIAMTVSVGVASFETGDVIAEPEVLADTLVDQADKALYQAKNRGRDCVVTFQPVN